VIAFLNLPLCLQHGAIALLRIKQIFQGSMSYCINPKCPKPTDPINARNLVCCHCNSALLLQDRYRVKHLLGEGGYGKTYEVDDRGTSKILKVLLLNDPKAVALFQQEARVLSQVHHPGIPGIEPDGYFTFYPNNTHQPLHCLVMEKIEGINLEQWLRQEDNQSLSQAETLTWLKQLVEILDRVHQQLYFHRDIKPSNILLTPDGQLVLIDFGSAREVSQAYLVKVDQEQDVRRMTSPGYTPIEQAKGKAVPQSDFFALGRTFVYLLTGKSPYDFPEDPRTGELLWQHQAPQVSKSVTDLIDDLMAPFPDKRPHNAQVILQRIAVIDRTWQPPQLPEQTSEFTNSLVGLQLQSWMRHHRSSTKRLKKLATKAAKPRNIFLASGVLASLGVAAVLMYVDLTPVLNQSPIALSSDRVSPPSPAAKPSPTQDASAPAAIAETDDAMITSIDSGTSSGINTIAISPDGKAIASGSRDGMVKLWSFSENTSATVAPVGRTLGEDMYGANVVAFSPDGKTLASGSNNNVIRIWDIETGQLLHTLKGHSAWVSDLIFSPDGKTLISSSFDRTIKVWNLSEDTQTQPVETRTLVGHTSGISAIALSPDGKTLVSGSLDNTIRIWDLHTGEIRYTLKGNTNRVFALAISSDGKILASGNGDGTIELWNVTTGQHTKTYQAHADWVRSLAISPDGTILASGSGSQDNAIKLWNLNSGKLLGTLKGHSDDVRSLAFSPDNTKLVSGSFDNTIKIWQMPQR
jgi:WD40 repeat protein/predicted Ser/Thr protein kinase